MRPTGKDREQQLFMRSCLMQVYWEWRDSEEWETTPSAVRWELLESCIARINTEVFRGL